MTGLVRDKEYFTRRASQENDPRLRQSPGCLYKVGIRPIGRTWQSIYSIQFTSILFTFVSLSFFCHALVTLEFGSSLPFCAEKRPVLLHESEGSLLLCSESNRASSRKHDNYHGVARQFCVPTEGLQPVS
jgi:hypothetical protein